MKELDLPNVFLRKVMALMHDCLYIRCDNDLYHLLDELNNLVPYNAAILCTLENVDGRNTLGSRLNHSYPASWVADYFDEQRYFDDPVVMIGGDLSEPFLWSSVISATSLQPSTEEFMALAADNGLREGLTFSARTPAAEAAKTLISLETGRTKVLHEHKHIVQYILPHIHEAWRRQQGAAQGQTEIPRLTLREREIIKWAYEGKTAWEIGVILSISERTVKFHLMNIYRKLDVSNRPHAVAKAMRFGLV